MRRAAAVIGSFSSAARPPARLRRQVAPASPYCRGGNPLAGVYHPSRLRVKTRCRVVIGTVSKVIFEPYDGDVHIDLRPRSLAALGRQRPHRREPRRRDDPVRPRARRRPRDGARIEVVGPWVEDDQHGWNEIHPAWWVSAGRDRAGHRRRAARGAAAPADQRQRLSKPRGGSPQQRPSACACYDAERG